MNIKYFFLLLALALAETSTSQTAQQHQPPPSNNYPFSRGMQVDCMNDIVNDYRNGNPTNAFADLKTYIRDNFITYIALNDLDHGKVIGQTGMENSLKKILVDLHVTFPLLKIAVIGNRFGYTTATGKLKVADYFNQNCKSPMPRDQIALLDSLINSAANNDDLQRSELLKFFLKAMKFSALPKTTCKQASESLFDVMYVNDPYWQNAATVGFPAVLNKFNSYCSSLQFLQLVKSYYSNVTLESEFQPTDLFWMNGWTITDQIEQADKLIDRMMIPFYTDAQSSSNAIAVNCRLLHLLSDRFSKNGTNFYAGFSAESNSYSFCNSTATPNEYLGRYLSGSTIPSGNMFSVESQFLNKLNDPNYFCSGCSCYPSNENQFAPGNEPANFCSGSIWLTYSMLKAHQLFRNKQEDKSELINYKMEGDHLNIWTNDESEFAFEIISISGRTVFEQHEKAPIQTIAMNDFNEGLYVLVVRLKDETISRLLPVHYK